MGSPVETPVSFLIDSHFHNDHNLTNRVYLDAFPGLTIVAHVETKKDMDLFGPGSADRVEGSNVRLQRMLDSGKNREGRTLTAEEQIQLKEALAHRIPLTKELAAVAYQAPTSTFERDFAIDLGNRAVEIKFLGRGNTAGDAVVYLPKEKIAVAGDLVVYPIPYIYDGYPSEWVGTMDRLAGLDATSIVPGHGPIMHDKTYLLLIRDLLKSAVDQMNAQRTSGSRSTTWRPIWSGSCSARRAFAERQWVTAGLRTEAIATLIHPGRPASSAAAMAGPSPADSVTLAPSAPSPWATCS
jgi:glyoxylase-like metal-dependent hydrolase (beta-lactamase superfamily II)